IPYKGWYQSSFGHLVRAVRDDDMIPRRTILPAAWIDVLNCEFVCSSRICDPLSSVISCVLTRCELRSSCSTAFSFSRRALSDSEQRRGECVTCRLALGLGVDGTHCILTRHGAIFELCLPVCPANALFTSGLLRETTLGLKSLCFRNQLFVGLVTRHGQLRREHPIYRLNTSIARSLDQSSQRPGQAVGPSR